MSKQTNPEKLDRLIEAGSNSAQSTFPPTHPYFETPQTLEAALNLRKKRTRRIHNEGYGKN